VAALDEGILLRIPAETFTALLDSGSLAAHKVVLALAKQLIRRMRTLLEADADAAVETQSMETP
jgi:CRP-like cAMP-binding protein